MNWLGEAHGDNVREPMELVTIIPGETEDVSVEDGSSTKKCIKTMDKDNSHSTNILHSSSDSLQDNITAIK